MMDARGLSEDPIDSSFARAALKLSHFKKESGSSLNSWLFEGKLDARISFKDKAIKFYQRAGQGEWTN